MSKWYHPGEDPDSRIAALESRVQELERQLNLVLHRAVRLIGDTSDARNASEQ